MKIKKETLLKLEILTRGVEFSEKALIKARDEGAKGQNLVYNKPINVDASRPQEVFIKAEDGYETVASCVAPNNIKNPVKVDTDENNNLIAYIDNQKFDELEITYVKEPKYYSEKLEKGEVMKKYVSACGYDELNIIPWRGCAISKGCRFCGVNTLNDKKELFNAFNISNDNSIWDKNREEYLKNLKKSINLALKDKCYDKHTHVILISGNLTDNNLDVQADIYSDIVENIRGDLEKRATEGIVVVMTPPNDISKLLKMKNSGIDRVVFNLEVGNDPWFSKYCPGKSHLGRDYFIERLEKSVEIFGVGNVWTNFVLGLEPVDKLLEVCDELGAKGIVSGANILHLDQGNSLDCGIPSKEDVAHFYYELAKIYKKYNFKPYYCQKALRTSIANEAFYDRIEWIGEDK